MAAACCARCSASASGTVRATEIAAQVGQALAFGLGLLGLLGGAPLLVFVALFVWLGAGGGSQAVRMREMSRGMIAADAMITRFETLSATARVARRGGAADPHRADRLPGGGWRRAAARHPDAGRP